MNKIDKHNKRIEEDFINKKASREKKILALESKIKILQKEIDELKKLNAAGPNLVTR